MNEPYILAMPGKPPEGAWAIPAPVRFRDPASAISLVPVTSAILSGERPFYSDAEIAADPAIAKSARAASMSNRIRKADGGDFASVRSSDTGMPCAAMFFLDGRERVLQALGIDPAAHWAVFLTPDEALFAPAFALKPSGIRRLVQGMRNRLASAFPGTPPILSTEVFRYDPSQGLWVEA